MKAIHPFPARMAPEIIDRFLQTSPSEAVVLDPMAGSGTVVRKAANLGRKAIGLDTDPLAVLMTRVASSHVHQKPALEVMRSIIGHARKYGPQMKLMSSIANCEETTNFVHFWFAERQLSEVNSLARAIQHHATNGCSSALTDLFKIGLSRQIITKTRGASLAADVSHSRPHKVRTRNDFDVFAGFQRSVEAILNSLKENKFRTKPKVRRDDARVLRTIKSNSIDCVITSPPYLNALDYLRGHKLSLVWLGETIPHLRQLRSTNIGTENTKLRSATHELDLSRLLKQFPELCALGSRQQDMVCHYVADLTRMQLQFQRVIKPQGKLHLVIGNSNIGTVFVKNSDLFAAVASDTGFRLVSEWQRDIPERRRYLPIGTQSNPLSKRMRTEVVQTYVRAIL